MKDSLGRPLIVGDAVAYVSRHGSRVFVTERVVKELLPGGRQVRLEPLSGSASPPVYAYNLVKVS